MKDNKNTLSTRCNLLFICAAASLGLEAILREIGGEVVVELVSLLWGNALPGNQPDDEPSRVARVALAVTQHRQVLLIKT